MWPLRDHRADNPAAHRLAAIQAGVRPYEYCHGAGFGGVRWGLVGFAIDGVMLTAGKGFAAVLGMMLRSWWVLVIRGLFAILFGVIALIWPDITVFALVTIFGAFTMLDGLIEIWVGFANRGREPHWWTDALLGVVSVFVGVAILAWPDISALALIYVIASWMIVIGALMVYQGIRLREDITGEFWVVSTGALSLVLGIGFMIFPGAGAVSLAWLIAFYIILLGVLMVKIGWGVGKIERNLRNDAIRQPPMA